MGAADPAKGLTMTTDHDDTDFEPRHSSSPTAHVLNELQLYGYRPFHDEADPRPLPEGNAVAGAISDIFDALVATLSDTRLVSRCKGALAPAENSRAQPLPGRAACRPIAL